VHKRDPAAGCAESGSLIDQAITGVSAGVEGAIEVGHPITDMVDSGPPALQEFCDGTGRIQRSEKLDFAFAERQRNNGRAVGSLGGMRHQPQHVAVECERCLEIRHGDTDVSDSGLVRHRFKVIR